MTWSLVGAIIPILLLTKAAGVADGDPSISEGTGTCPLDSTLPCDKASYDSHLYSVESHLHSNPEQHLSQSDQKQHQNHRWQRYLDLIEKAKVSRPHYTMPVTFGRFTGKLKNLNNLFVVISGHTIR
jgi:hypothetical protein